MTRTIRPGRERGSMLIVALGVLTLMSLLAITFVKLVGIEKIAATNYVDSVKAKLLAEAGIQRVVADMRRTITSDPTPYSDATKAWVYKRQAGEPRYDIPVEKVDPMADPYFFDALGRSYPNPAKTDPRRDAYFGFDIYKVKVVDTSAQIDLNGKQAVLAQMLDALGEAIAKVPRAEYTGGRQNPVKEARWEAFRGGEAIVKYRETLDGQRYTSKTQLERIMQPQHLKRLRDYVTTEAWIDPWAVSAAESGTRAHDVTVVPRAPINVNLAMQEVLAAVIAPLAGRRMMFYVTRTVQDIEQGNADVSWSGGPRPTQSGATLREETAYEVRQNWVYIEPFGGDVLTPASMDKALAIARWIVTERVPGSGTGGSGGPFKSPQDFCARLDAAIKAGTISDAMLPNAGNAKSYPDTTNPLFDISGLFKKWPQDGAHGDAFRAWHREAAVSILKAAFTPAFFNGSINPNTAAYMPVDKGNLLYPKDPASATALSTLRPVQTVDFCYQTRGVYEVTSLGEVRGRSWDPARPDENIIATEKVLTVVRILGQITHRSQFEFEKWDKEYTSGTPARLGTTTYPEPKNYWAGANLSTRQDRPPPDLAVERYGHMELEPKNKFAPGGNLYPPSALGAAQFGNIRFANFFEKFLGTPPAMSLPMMSYLWADIAGGSQVPTPGAATSGYAQPVGTAPPGRTSAERSHPERMNTGGFVTRGIGLHFRDGLYSGLRAERDRHLWFRAASDIPRTDAQNQGLLGVAAAESAPGDHKQGNLCYRKGGVEFWYKPDYDWSYPDPGVNKPGAPAGRAPMPRFCGLFFGSQVRSNPGNPESAAPPSGDYLINPSTPTDGTQIYVFRNTEGQIRATRLYYRVVGQDTQDIPTGFYDPDPADAYPTTTIAEYRRAAEAWPDKYVWPPGEFLKGTPNLASTPPVREPRDADILYARVDSFVDFQYLANWKSNEWHHIAVYWDDAPATNQGEPNSFLKIYVDGVLLSSAHRLPADLSSEKNKYQFVRLNEDHAKKYPRDHVYVGSLERWQQSSGEGIFKHRSSSGDSHIELFANGSIDDVLIYDGTSPQGNNLPSMASVPRFEQRGNYTQHFDLGAHFPTGTQPLELAFFTWTLFLPTRHGGNVELPNGAGSATVRLRDEGGKFRIDGNITSNRDEAAARVLNTDGSPAYAFPPSGTNQNRVFYDVTLRAATFDANGTSYPRMANVDTPIFAEATLSYFLPYEETLLKERVVD